MLNNFFPQNRVTIAKIFAVSLEATMARLYVTYTRWLNNAQTLSNRFAGVLEINNITISGDTLQERLFSVRTELNRSLWNVAGLTNSQLWGKVITGQYASINPPRWIEWHYTDEFLAMRAEFLVW